MCERAAGFDKVGDPVLSRRERTCGSDTYGRSWITDRGATGATTLRNDDAFL